MKFVKKIKRYLRRVIKGPNPPKHDYIADIAEEAGWPYEEASEKVKSACSKLGISPEVYLKGKYYKKSWERQQLAARRFLSKERSNKKRAKRIAKKTGKTAAEVLARVDSLNAREDTTFDIDLQAYERYGLYELDDDEAVKIINVIGELKARAKVLNGKLAEVDEGTLTYTDIQSEIDAYYGLTRSMITPHLREIITKKYDYLLSGMNADEERTTEFIADIEVMNSLLGFTQDEYIIFHMYDASFPEKREYVSKRDRGRMVGNVNTSKVTDVLIDKYNTYKRMPELFGREMTEIRSADDFDAFADFVERHPAFVIKPFTSCTGKGVALVTVDTSDKKGMKEQFTKLIEANRMFLMEERIVQNEKTAAFNKDSINTVRLITYFKDGKFTPVGAFFKTGRVGSFVDNGGAGGVFAAVDTRTGRLMSDGADERGTIYLEHPDSHVRYRDFQLPVWEKALRLGENACRAIGVDSLIGWDIACNDKNEWVIVEGNSKSTFLHQGPLLHGVRSQVKEIMDF